MRGKRAKETQSIYQTKKKKKGIKTEAEKKKSQSMKNGKALVMKTNLNKSKFFIKRKRLPDWIKK